MHLDAALPVVLIQALKVVLHIALTVLVRVDVNGHGPAHHRHAVVEREDLLVVEIEQHVLKRLQPLLRFDHRIEVEIVRQQALKLAKGGVDEQILATQPRC